MLARHRVPAMKRDDLVQETAARLVSMWDKVDPDRDVWPLAKTIALNLLRDEARRVHEEIPTEIEADRTDDLDPVLMARLEWNRVVTALSGLSPQHRAALLSEIGEGTRTGSAAEKMLRMRARRSLREALKSLPAMLPARLRSLELGSLFGPVAQTAVPGLACVACLSLISTGLAPKGTDPQVPRGEIRVLVAQEIGDGAPAFSYTEDNILSKSRGAIDTTTTEPSSKRGSTSSTGEATESTSPSSGTSTPALPTPPSLPTKGPVDDDSTQIAAPPAASEPEVPGVPLPKLALGVEAVMEELLDS